VRIEHGDRVGACCKRGLKLLSDADRPVRFFARKDTDDFLTLTDDKSGTDVLVRYVAVCEPCFAACGGDMRKLRDIIVAIRRERGGVTIHPIH